MLRLTRRLLLHQPPTPSHPQQSPPTRSTTTQPQLELEQVLKQNRATKPHTHRAKIATSRRRCNDGERNHTSARAPANESFQLNRTVLIQQVRPPPHTNSTTTSLQPLYLICVVCACVFVFVCGLRLKRARTLLVSTTSLRSV